MSTELRLNTEVACADGPAGRLTDVVLHPATEQVTHLVVEAPGFGNPRHLVPVALLEASAGREVHLRCSRAELARTEFFTETEALPADDAMWFLAEDSLALPLGFPRSAMQLAEYDRVPPGELALHGDTRVTARDGLVGRVEAFVLQPDGDRVVDLIFRRGHLWRRRDIVIPATAIERIDAEAVHLRLTRATVEALPVLRPGTAA
jgi:sporulation protein YlmC with PRC-barrel domain